MSILTALSPKKVDGYLHNMENVESTDPRPPRGPPFSPDPRRPSLPNPGPSRFRVSCPSTGSPVSFPLSPRLPSSSGCSPSTSHPCPLPFGPRHLPSLFDPCLPLTYLPPLRLMPPSLLPTCPPTPRVLLPAHPPKPPAKLTFLLSVGINGAIVASAAMLLTNL
jgi:hypothetical protein